MNELAPGAVTTADLYRVLVDMQGSMAKLAGHLERVDSRNEAADKLHTDHEARLRILEQFRYKLAGLATLGGIAAGLLGNYLAQHLH